MTTTTTVIALLMLALGVLAGGAGGFLLATRAGVSAGALAARERQVIDLAESRFREAGAHASGDLALRALAVDAVVSPVRSALERVEQRLGDVERARVEASAGMAEQLHLMTRASDQLRAETAALAGALRSPNTRGRWGEVQLRRVVEHAGMLEHCDFSEQAVLKTSDGRQRPDLVVHVAGGRSVVVDAKVPLGAFFDVSRDKGSARLEHAKALRAHVDSLAAKTYWAAVQPGPEIVVLFVPGESFLAPALDADPGLLDHAMAKGVVLATPTVLLTLLRTIAFGWQQDSLADGAREVVAAGRELHRRLGTLASHVDRLGRSLSRSVEDYNAAVGSFERTVTPAARRLTELGATSPPANRSPGARAGFVVPEPLVAVAREMSSARTPPRTGEFIADNDDTDVEHADNQGDGGAPLHAASRLRG